MENCFQILLSPILEHPKVLPILPPWPFGNMYSHTKFWRINMFLNFSIKWKGKKTWESFGVYQCFSIFTSWFSWKTIISKVLEATSYPSWLLTCSFMDMGLKISVNYSYHSLSMFMKWVVDWEWFSPNSDSFLSCHLLSISFL